MDDDGGLTARHDIALSLIEEQSLPFLREVFWGLLEGWVTITYEAPIPDLTPKIVTQWYHVDDVLRYQIDPDAILRGNTKGYGVHYGLAVRRERKSIWKRGKARDATHITCLWADVDLKPERGIRTTEDALQRFLDFPLPASYIIKSGGGMHGIWLLRKPVPLSNDRVRHLIATTIKGMSLDLGGDQQVAEFSHTLRLPGTVNTKPERHGALCEIVEALPGRYTLDAFRTYYHLAECHLGPVYTPSRHIPQSGDAVYKIRRVEQYLSSGAPVGHRNAELFWCACRFRDAGLTHTEAEAVLGQRARLDGFGNREIQTVIRSAYGYAPSPASNLERNDRRQIAAHDKVIETRARYSKRERA